MQNDLTDVKRSTNSRIPTFPSSPSVHQQATSSTSPSPPLPTSCAHTYQEKTSRHTQTAVPGQRQHRSSDKPKSSQGSSSLRPIRPLFLPCPWQTGRFPSGPVRNIPPFSSNQATKNRANSMSRTRRPKTQGRNPLKQNDLLSSSSASAPRPPLITEFNAAPDSSRPPPSYPSGPSAPAYDLSLNF